MERDLHDAGVDVGDPVLMGARSWRWLTTRIFGLVDRPVAHDIAGNALPVNRIQRHFMQTTSEVSPERASH